MGKLHFYDLFPLEQREELKRGALEHFAKKLPSAGLKLPMVREEAISPDTQGLLDSLETNVRRGADMVRQILVFSRWLESAKAPLQSRHLLRECALLVQETFPKNHHPPDPLCE